MNRTCLFHHFKQSSCLNRPNFQRVLPPSFVSLNNQSFSKRQAHNGPPSTSAGDALINSSRLHAFQKTQTISKAMRAYLKNTREKEIMLEKENAEFELGKRHLANMMGLNPDTMTQDDVDGAIRYLLPSGLFAHRARPMMKPPSEIFPPITPAEFSADGRPYDDMFYTLRPRFYQHLYVIYEKVEKLDEIARKMKSEGKEEIEDESHQIINLTGTKWLDQQALCNLFMHKVNEEETAQFAAAMDHLAAHPLAHLEEQFISAHRQSVNLMGSKSIEMVTETKTDENGRVYAEATARKKSSDAYVKVYKNGSGKIAIDGGDMMNLEMTQSREQILFPFIILDRHDEFDIEATTQGGGESGKVVAIRMAVCKALCPFLTEPEIEKLKFAGLLTRDVRRKERKKWERIGARERPVWKRR